MPSEFATPPLEPSDAFLAAIIESSDDAIISKDLSGVITSWNPGAERLFGYTALEAIGQPITLIFPADRLDEEPSILARIAKGERIEHYETVRKHKSGRLVDISLTVSPIRNLAGQIVGASKIARNITESKHEQERFRVTLSSIGDAVMCADVNGHITFMNKIAEDITGYTQRDAMGRPLESVFRIVNETTRATVESPVTKVLREGTIVGLANHTILIAKDGSERPIDDSAAPIRTAQGELTGVVLVFRDVSDRRRDELAALRLAAIVDSLEDAITGKNLKGIVTDWNRGAEHLLGYTADEMIGRSITLLLPPDRQNEEAQILQRLQRGERVEHFETVRVRKDGRQIHVSLTISPIRDADGHIVGASKIARDVTAQKEADLALRAVQAKLESHALELEQKVRERTGRLQDMVGELEAFSYSLSHDLRAPLRAIQGFTELVLTDYGDKIPEGVDYLRRVINAAGRMDRLIQDVLAFARISRQELTVQPVDVEKLIRDIIEERPELQLPRATVVVAEPLLPVIGHDASLTQCLTNLLDNAVKFVRTGVAPQVRVSTEAHGDKVRIKVKDNGIGIEREAQRRLFALFQRLATVQSYHGTGIGLAIVRKAAERMGGNVGVESAPNEGSTFWVELPKA
jgi:PAS domain S-box-containing protein